MATPKPEERQGPTRRLAERFVTIDGHNLRNSVSAGLAWLRTHQQVVNSLNVFPVPDGDTGTNMALTMQAAWDEVEAQDDRSVSVVAHAIAQGALMGARGNSGVILSQLWRGFARATDGRDELDADGLVQALAEARDTAYKGVVRPVEGTILTVSKDMAAAAQEARNQGAHSILRILQEVVQAADQSVQRTPELLPVLREAGVVDSGGKGLHFIIEGMIRSAYGLPLDQPNQEPVDFDQINLEGAVDAIEPGQDWEVVVDFRPNPSFELQDFYRRLEDLGTSIQVGEGEGLYRMHIHVRDDTQYQPIDYIRSLGTVTEVHLENLMDQVNERSRADGAADLHLANVEPGQVAVVAVSPGPGIARIFANLGAAAVIEGGQTMNPSTQEILASFENLPTASIVILPNNKNIQLAATQACELTVKDVRVIPTKSVPQGVAAMFEYAPDGELGPMAEAMEAALDDVTSAELTRATRSVQIDGVDVKEGDVIGLLNGKLIVSGDDLEQCLIDLLHEAGAGEAEIIALYHAEDVPHQTANQIMDELRQRWPEVEFELIDGGQPHYDFIVSIE